MRRGCDNRGMAPRNSPEPLYTPTFIRAWRESRGMAIGELAARTGIDKGNLSKVERALLPWNQGVMEKIADALECSVSDLLVRDPNDAAPIWSIRSRATDEQWEQIAKVAEALIPFKHK